MRTRGCSSVAAACACPARHDGLDHVAVTRHPGHP